MLERIELVKPADIEARSMEIIRQELQGETWPEPEFSIVKRCIHTSADFDYARNLCFSKDAAKIGVEALKRGASIVTDTRMAASGINKKRLAEYGGEVHCFMDAPEVAEEAARKGCTRAAVCMERAAGLSGELFQFFLNVKQWGIPPSGDSQWFARVDFCLPPEINFLSRRMTA